MSDERNDAQSQMYLRAQKISEEFSTQPLSGEKTNIWVRRETLERELAFKLGTVDQHICIDGPSGSGKTSLAQRIFFSQARAYIHIQITTDMTWPAFARQFIELPMATKTSKSISGRGVLSFFNPTLESSATHNEEYSERESYELALKKAEAWKSHDVAKWIQDNNVVLIVDDIENANPELFTSIVSMLKLFGQSFTGKIVIVGIDDVLKRILAINDSLNKRISEVTVGGLPDIDASAHFLISKFNRLGIQTPFDKYGSEEDRDLCKGYIYDAANGLMKELNALGLALAEELKGSRNRLNVADFKEACKKFTRSNRQNNRDAIKKIARVLQSNADYMDVFNYLVSKSTSAITPLSELEEALGDLNQSSNIQSAAEYLSENGIVTITGAVEQRVFFRNPSLMNCIKTHLIHSDVYGWDPINDRDVAEGMRQISLGLTGGRLSRKLP